MECMTHDDFKQAMNTISFSIALMYSLYYATYNISNMFIYRERHLPMIMSVIWCVSIIICGNALYSIYY